MAALGIHTATKHMSMPILVQASVALTYTATPFTLANFTSSLLLVATNVNGTNQVPQGAPRQPVMCSQICLAV